MLKCYLGIPYLLQDYDICFDNGIIVVIPYKKEMITGENWFSDGRRCHERVIYRRSDRCSDGKSDYL